MHRNHSLPAGRQGFTLVELLVYTAIFAIVAGLLTTIFYVVINTQKKTSVSGEVSQQLNLVLVTVQRLVGDASLVEAVYEGSNPSSTCTTFCTLKLRREDPAKDPTIISSDATGIYLQEGSSPQVTLTTNKVLINHFRLTKQEIPGGHAVVEISTSFAYNTLNPTFAVTKAIESAIARVDAATFDADLIPNQDNTFDVGQVSGSSLRWRNGRFSGDLTVGGQITISGGSPSSGKVLTSDASGVGSWQVAAGVPAGAVMFFNLASCPSGWTELTAARGRTITGLPSGGALAGTVGTALTNLENRTHTHSVPITSVIFSSSNLSNQEDGEVLIADDIINYFTINRFDEAGGGWWQAKFTPSMVYENPAGRKKLSTKTATTGSASTSDVIPYIQLLTCQKS